MPNAYLTKRHVPGGPDYELTATPFEPQFVSVRPTDGIVGSTDNTVVLEPSMWICAFETTEIPIGATVNKAKLVMTATRDDSTTFTADVGYLGAGAFPNLHEHSEAFNFENQVRLEFKDTAGTSLGVIGSSSDWSYVIPKNDQARAAGQVLTLTATGNGQLGSMTFILSRQGAGTNATVRAELWTLAGPSGKHTRGYQLATSDKVALSSISTGTGPIEFTFPAPVTVASGQRYIGVVTTDNFIPFDELVNVVIDVGASRPADNSIVIDSPLKGFAVAAYVTGTEVWEQKDFDVTLETFTPISFDDGVQYEFGDAAYSPDQTWTTFTGGVQSALDLRTRSDENITFFLKTNTVADWVLSRNWRAFAHGSPQTVDGNSYHGVVIVVDYTAPTGQVRSFLARARPAVSAGVATARPAVSPSAEPRARFTVIRAELPRARASVRSGMIRARPAVRHFPAGPRSL